MRRFLVAVSAVGLFAFGLAGCGPGSQLWASRYDPGNADVASDVATSPDGTRVFITERNDADAETVAYDAANGDIVWHMHFVRLDPTEIAVSGDGARVFVTGSESTPNDIETVAYDAATGAQLWSKAYDHGSDDFGRAIASSADGTKVFITGQSLDPTTGADTVTVAYDAVTGNQVWAHRYDGPAHANDAGADLALSPDGARVFVTGQSRGSGTAKLDVTTIAYSATNGSQLWVKRYNGPAGGDDIGRAVAVAPDGVTIFVTGPVLVASTNLDYGTIAYNASNGTQRWLKLSHPSGDSNDSPFAIAASPDGSKVFVTGTATQAPGLTDYATLAYDAATGATAWSTRYNGAANSNDDATDIAVSGDSASVVVTGGSFIASPQDWDYATVSYDTANGNQQWVTRYDGPGSFDHGRDIAIAGSKVFVTGDSQDAPETELDTATVAYQLH